MGYSQASSSLGFFTLAYQRFDDVGDKNNNKGVVAMERVKKVL
jgi:hypothetical protein